MFILNWEGRRHKRRSLGTVMSGFEEHIQLYLYNKMNNKQYHTVGTVLKSNRKTNNTTLGTILKSNRKTNNTTLWEQF